MAEVKNGIFYFQILCDRLLKENKGKLLLWLQKVLIECCFIKLCSEDSKTDDLMEPIPRLCIRKKL